MYDLTSDFYNGFVSGILIALGTTMLGVTITLALIALRRPTRAGSEDQ